MHHLISCESVSNGHPDKICDQISDLILDMYLLRDPASRVAVECLVTTNLLIIAGEIRSNAEILHAEIESVVRDHIRSIGYNLNGFHHENIVIQILLHEQSSDIALGVDLSEKHSHSEGAGDQGMMFGYACDELSELDIFIPAQLYYAHHVLRNLANMRRSFPEIGILPDAKIQLTMKYDDHKPIQLHALVLSMHHKESLSEGDVNELAHILIKESLPEEWLNEEVKFYINPTGRFIIGGPQSDTGLTGRKIIADTYGGFARHGGGAFSGKDPTKVDRSAAYMARFLAKNFVAATIAKRCTIQLAYIIGIERPISLFIDFHSTGKISEDDAIQYIYENFDLTPRGIFDRLSLRRPIYLPTSTYGHFGRKYQDDGFFTWEDTSIAASIRKALLRE